MRPVQLADLEAATRVLMRVAPETRRTVMHDMIACAQKADRYRIITGRPHPRWGTGTLMSRALRQQMAPRPAALEPDTLHAYAVALGAVMAHTSHQSV